MIQQKKDMRLAAELRHKTGRENMTIIVAAIKTRPLTVSATTKAHMPSKNPNPMPIS
jgi:hypothetical protein